MRVQLMLFNLELTSLTFLEEWVENLTVCDNFLSIFYKPYRKKGKDLN